MKKVLFILGELDDSDLQWMIDAGTVLDTADGDVLIAEGKRNERLFIVIDGEASVCLAALGGKEIARVSTGEVLGEMSLLDSRPPNATVKSVGRARVFVLEHDAIRTHMERDPRFAAHFYRAISIFLANRLNRAQLMSTQADPKLAENEQDEDELSPELMDNVNLSGHRFLTFLDRLRAR